MDWRKSSFSGTAVSVWRSGKISGRSETARTPAPRWIVDVLGLLAMVKSSDLD